MACDFGSRSLTMLHQDSVAVASIVFKEAGFYDKARTGYAPKNVQTLLQKLGVFDSQSKPITILELAAGTGQFTKEISKAIEGRDNIRQIASEPVAEMSQVLLENNPGIEYIRCRAEKIPLPDNSVDAVVTSSAIHYFSNVESFTEISRVLVPGGMLGVVCKNPDPIAIPWVLEFLQENAKFYQNVGVKYHMTDDGEDLIGWGPVIEATGLFGNIEKMIVKGTNPMDENGAIEYFMSFGAFHACTQAEREKLRQRVVKVIRSNYSEAGKVMTELPFTCFLYWMRNK